MRKKSLQIATALLGFIPVITGALTLMGLDDPLYLYMDLPRNALLDSNLRFLGGVWLALGLAAWWTVPRIERRGQVFHVVWGAIWLGGIGRMLSIFLIGLPPLPFIGFMLLEIVGAPLFIWWQWRVARAHAFGRNEEAEKT